MTTPTDANPNRRPVPAGVALIVVVAALLVGLVLNAPDILRTAQRQEAGWQRTLGVGLMEPIAGVSEFLFLDRPRQAIDAALDRGPMLAQAPTTTVPTVPSTTAAGPEPTAPSTTVGPQRREVTAADPLVVYIGGDSLVGQFGPMLDNRMAESGLVEAEFVYEFESGLSRPDFVDWPVRLASVSDDLDPDVFVLYFGGNDAQAIYMPDGTWIEYDTPEWEAEYRSRVAGVMDMLAEAGHWVYWMGMPIVQSDTFRPRVEFLNQIYESEAKGRERMRFVEAWSVFQGPDGGYSEYLTNSEGDLVDMRLDDGVHYTTAGAIRLAEVVYDIIATDWNLTP